ncbi:hypothetical protein APS67_005440 [Streptomyces sp. AVP053U2]|nr:hypothetical protein APS67_005440 [Streptomyces sp. AVP053U2]
MSRVTTKAVNPAALARPRKLREISGSFGQYGWNRCSASPIVPATCSIGVLEVGESTNGTPCAAAARAAAGSVSGCISDSTPTGAGAGAGSARPSTSTDRSRSCTSRSMRGTIRWRAGAARLARAVLPPPVLPAA